MTLKILLSKRILKCYLLTTNKIMGVNHLFFKESDINRPFYWCSEIQKEANAELIILPFAKFVWQ